MQQYLQNKKELVQNVFDQVYDKYDLMNDFMSLGVHRLWKKNLLNMMNPSPNQKLVDVACGTGDIAKLFLEHVSKSSQITCVDPNRGMIKKGKEKLNRFKNLNWINSSAEKLPLDNNLFDFYTISFGLRNTKNLDTALSEAYRVLKPGGRFFCLEFSKIQKKYDKCKHFFQPLDFARKSAQFVFCHPNLRPGERLGRGGRRIGRPVLVRVFISGIHLPFQKLISHLKCIARDGLHV